MQILMTAIAAASLFAAGQANDQRTLPPVAHQPISIAWDVPAVAYTVKPSYPCEPSDSATGFVTAVCVSPRPKVHYKCADSARLLLTSEDGVHHCILFPQQEEETVTVTGEK